MIQPTELIPYARHQITADDEAAVLGVLRSKWLTQGPKVEEFEAALATLCDAKYAVCTNSGASALYLSAGTCSASHIVTTPITFAATINLYLGSNLDAVQFLDVDPATGRWPAWYPPNSVGGISLPVTLGGVPFDGRSAATYGRILIDATHSLGAVYPGHTLAACFSFHPAKHVACGEGGAVVTNHEVIATVVRAMVNHGRSGATRWRAGFNMRMPEMSAALGLSQLQRLPENIQRRRFIAQYYDEYFRGTVRFVVHPPGSVYHLYQILVKPERRDEIQLLLRHAHIGTAIHYPALLPLPNALSFAASTLSIPMFPTLTDAEVEYVAGTVKEVVGQCQ